MRTCSGWTPTWRSQWTGTSLSIRLRRSRTASSFTRRMVTWRRNWRSRFVSGDWFKGSDEEYRAEASSYIAYMESFHVDEAKGTLTHSTFVSLFPDWTGQNQPRVVSLGTSPRHPVADQLPREDSEFAPRLAARRTAMSRMGRLAGLLPGVSGE
jgi:hypothetical protein